MQINNLAVVCPRPSASDAENSSGRLTPGQVGEGSAGPRSCHGCQITPKINDTATSSPPLMVQQGNVERLAERAVAVQRTEALPRTECYSWKLPCIRKQNPTCREASTLPHSSVERDGNAELAKPRESHPETCPSHACVQQFLQ